MVLTVYSVGGAYTLDGVDSIQCGGARIHTMVLTVYRMGARIHTMVLTVYMAMWIPFEGWGCNCRPLVVAELTD